MEPSADTGSGLEAAEPEAAPVELRSYWDPALRYLSSGAALLIAAVMAVLIVESAHKRHSAFGVVVGAAVVTLAASGWLVWSAFRAGVRESATGLVGRVGTYSGKYAWADLDGFEYARAGPREIVLARTPNGRKVVVRGARRLMRWHGGGLSDDFAALLNERLAAFRPRADTRTPPPDASPPK